ncbi:hypothetical protein UPYG_G00295130 [Umbra pygmaea]|uniref:Homeobox domain-containing protein n=1 Tax=Umbra pygmaea TaxID=75934 RepID=A0ABD0W5H6_UMBPY
MLDLGYIRNSPAGKGEGSSHRTQNAITSFRPCIGPRHTAIAARCACKRKEQDQGRERNLVPKKQRLVFTDLQRRTLAAIFRENRRPSKEMQITISQQLGLELSTVSNFFMSIPGGSCRDRWSSAGEGNEHNGCVMCLHVTCMLTGTTTTTTTTTTLQ